MYKTAKTIKSWGFKVEYETSKVGNETKNPKRYVCPNCLKNVKGHTKNITLQRKAAANAVIGSYRKTKIALCYKCGWQKSNSPEKANKRRETYASK